MRFRRNEIIICFYVVSSNIRVYIPQKSDKLCLLQIKGIICSMILIYEHNSELNSKIYLDELTCEFEQLYDNKQCVYVRSLLLLISKINIRPCLFL